ncbi:hypothetical protein SLS62_004568 [Diatrype stigma]|uniref:Uncharacterized protein n=1 Tax=Diatrype stigma TaxID=117547 RepID=A0AAN9UT23_9PEZI
MCVSRTDEATRHIDEQNIKAWAGRLSMKQLSYHLWRVVIIGLLLRKLDQLPGTTHQMVRHYTATSDDFKERSLELVAAATGEGKFRD